MNVSLSALGARDRRALLVGVLALVVYAAIVGIRSYGTALGHARQLLEAQRELLAQELGMIEVESSIDGRLQDVAASFATRSETMFSAADSLAAVSDLSAFLLDAARRNRVHVEYVESRSSSTVTEGVVTLMVVLRGRSDLEGLMDFTMELEKAARLIRVEQLSVTRLPTAQPSDASDDVEPPDVQVLEFSALITGYSLPRNPPDAEG